MDLSSRLASTVHDVKNKLQLISSTADNLTQSPDDTVRETGISILRGLMDVNEELVALLGLYKLAESKIVFSQEVFVFDLLSACTTYTPSNLEAKVECDDDLVGFFDENLVRSVIFDAFHNGVKFAKSRIVLAAVKQGRGIVISIEDDGPGFRGAEKMKDKKGTGLGLYFADQVATAHRNHGEDGSVDLLSSVKLGGARFSMYLP